MNPQQSKEWFDENPFLLKLVGAEHKCVSIEDMYEAFKARLDAEREGGE